MELVIEEGLRYGVVSIRVIEHGFACSWRCHVLHSESTNVQSCIFGVKLIDDLRVKLPYVTYSRSVVVLEFKICRR